MTQTERLFASQFSTPLGYMGAVCDDSGLRYLDWQQSPLSYDLDENDVSRETIHQLHLYLKGKLVNFTVPLSDVAVSASLLKWLHVMRDVPYGETVSYAELANMWGNPKAARAAGSACQRNPLPIIFPCHRIIGSDGRYDNYSGGDRLSANSPANVARKKTLLDLEAGLKVIME